MTGGSAGAPRAVARGVFAPPAAPLDSAAMLRIAVLRLCLALVWAMAASAQGVIDADPAAVFLDRLHVKFAEGTGAAWDGQGFVSRCGVDLRPVSAAVAGARVEPLVRAVAWDELDRWHRQACAVMPPKDRPGHLGLWFKVTCASADAARAVRERLAREPLVAHVHHEPRYALAAHTLPVPGDIPPTTPLFTSSQLTHNPSPQGHGVRATADLLGARGQGIRFVMIEDTFLLGHEDVSQLVAANFVGAVPTPDLASCLHGVSGASMLLADRNSYGLTGIADEVDARFVGVYMNGGFENSLAVAAQNSQPCDVVLIVLILQVPSLGPGSWVPFEYFQSAYDATATATALGRLVVVPGGNGNLSLDDPALLGRFDRNVRDSGAIMVAASLAGPMGRIGFANWGSRMDCHSWGDGVASCGYPGLFYPNNDNLQAYTAAATGTSASTPQIAGVVCALQGLARRQLGQPLTNSQMRSLLWTHGPASPDAIGRRPDMVAMAAAIGAVDGLRLNAPDFDLLDTVQVQMSGTPGGIACLFASLATGDVDLGFNRRVHLDLNTADATGAFAMPNGTATWQTLVPNNPALHGTSLYFQAVRLEPNATLTLSTSCQATVR